MADLHETFTEFNRIIALSSTKKNELRTSRNSIRKDIETYFDKNRDKHTVKFKGQGSFAMNTTILPISGEYDVDDGVYIFGKEEDKPTPNTAHNWIFKAVENRTNQETIDKNTCVRVQYAKSYHVDLPIYYKTTDTDNENFFDSEDIPELAHKTKGWIESDPYAFKKWFDEKAKDKNQLKRIVRYLKAWTDNKSHLNLPSGMVFTILAVNNYVSKDRDDESFLETLQGIQKSIDDTRHIWAKYECYRPTVDTLENLLDKYSSETRKKDFLDALNSLITSGKQAVEVKSKKDACAKWQKHIGDRFPCSSINEKDEDVAKAFASPDLLRYDNKSA
ncbi:CBASS cGAMP synthase [Mariniflexile aquimaris]|uniref:Cyclic GMP-AMP synthase n=1 Tax=Mariniflexile aquimaris TaxID=881009 RepID=A0ABW3BW21_9FLAO